MLDTLRQHLRGDHSIVTIVVVTFLFFNLTLITIDSVASIVGLVDNPVLRKQIYFVWLIFQFAIILPIQWISLAQSCRFQIAAFKNYGGSILTIVFSIVFTLLLFQYNFPGESELASYWKIARGVDNYHTDISVENDVLMLSGSLELGSAKKVALAIKANKVQKLELDLSEGQLYEAREIARLVREQKLDVLVTRSCLAPCTLILASGRQRVVSEDAKIGFQSYKILYPDPRSRWFEEQEEKRDMNWLKQNDVSESFVFQTFYSRTNQNYWYPELPRLIEVGYIDQIINLK